MTQVRTLVFVVVLAALGGCATLSESQCSAGDWFGIGESDARAGHTPDRLGRHDEACARYGVAPDPVGYDAGYRQGLAYFCVPREAFLLGSRGASYYRQCPPEIERDFIPAYELGIDVHAIAQDIARIDAEIEQLRDEIDDDKTSEVAREGAGQRLDHAKDERRRREYDRDRLLERARMRGYGEVW